MLKSCAAVRRQLCEIISFIFNYDSPQKCQELMDSLVDILKSDTYSDIDVALHAVHLICKRYRYKTTELWVEIKFVLDRLAKPLTDLVIKCGDVTKTNQMGIDTQEKVHSIMLYASKIFYSLSSQNLPECFKTNLKIWMEIFHAQLVNDLNAHTDVSI